MLNARIVSLVYRFARKYVFVGNNIHAASFNILLACKLCEISLKRDMDIESI